MLIALLLILSTSLAPLPLTASPTALKASVQCVYMLVIPPTSVHDCTNLLSLMTEHIIRYKYDSTYHADDFFSIGRASCYFQMRAKDPSSGVSEVIKMVDYFPALEQIRDQCLETPEEFKGGTTDVGEHFLASLGALGILVRGRNETVGREGGNHESAGIGVVIA